jgi:hypothetical protein
VLYTGAYAITRERAAQAHKHAPRTIAQPRHAAQQRRASASHYTMLQLHAAGGTACCAQSDRRAAAPPFSPFGCLFVCLQTPPPPIRSAKRCSR